ncbi:MAG: hypothetical protein CMD83_02105 [Gammaproteobacteria bacterium]|nr:hypothetical protein [Gammaproteobacteria bacterium]
MMEPDHAKGPLVGLRVLDISRGIAGPFCAKLLGDLGADVVKVEPPGGDPTRSEGPFPDGTPDAEKSAGFFFLNTSKRGIVLDVDDPLNHEVLARLVRRYDVVVADGSAESLEARGIGYDTVSSWNPRVVYTSVSGFGSFGPNSEWDSSHLVNCAVGGWAHLCGVPEREPLQAGGQITETLTGAFAAVATQLAALGRARHGHGEHVDVSAQEAVLAGAQLPTLLYEYRGILPGRYSSIGSGAGAAYILGTEDGYIGLNALTGPQWRMLCDFLGRADIAEDPKYAGISWTEPDERLEEIREIFRAALAGRTAEQLFHEAEAHRVPFGLVPDLAGLYAFPPHVERGFFADLEHPVAGKVSVPGIPFKSTATAAAPFRPPMLGEHTEEVLAEPAAELPAASSQVHDLPLAGLRVLDLSMFFAGPVAAQICADAGADVVKVESLQRIDGWRGAGTDGDGDMPSYEGSPYFNWVNRGKRDVTLNLNDPRGAEAVKTMVREADVLIENYTPRVMGKFGLDYDTLRAINPKLVMLSLSGFGADTSWRDYVAFGMSTEQMCGVSHLTGYADDDPIFTGMTGGDLFAGVMGANALFAALAHRDRTGQGQHINLSQMEACNLYVGDSMTGYSLAGVDPGRIGNRHLHYAPQGIYPCRDEAWLGITVKSDAAWRALAGAIGQEELAERYPDAAARHANADAIDAFIGAWSAGQNHLEAQAALQSAGVAAGAVMRGTELLEDEHLAARDSFLLQDRPGLGPKHYPNQPYRFRNAPPAPNVRAPLLGEHLSEVLTSYAGLSDDDIVELVIDDVTGTVPLAAR